MSKTKTSLPFGKRAPELELEAGTSGAMFLRETVSMPGIGLTIPVRAAKAKLSALLDLVARGQEVTITSDGRPKARLVKVEPSDSAPVFRGMGEFLTSQPIHKGPTADEIIRSDRDGRGWRPCTLIPPSS